MEQRTFDRIIYPHLIKVNILIVKVYLLYSISKKKMYINAKGYSIINIRFSEKNRVLTWLIMRQFGLRSIFEK